MLAELGNDLKNLLLAGVGAVAVTAEKSEELLKELVKRGELTVEQGKVVNEELKHKAKQKLKDHVTVNVVKDYGDLIDAVDDMSEEDLDRLMDRIEAKKQASENTPEDTPEESKEDEQ